MRRYQPTLFCGKPSPIALNPWEASALESNGSSTAQSCGRSTGRQLASLNVTRRRPDGGIRLGKVLAGAPLVAEVEAPAEIQREPLARSGLGHGGGPGTKGQGPRQNDHRQAVQVRLHDAKGNGLGISWFSWAKSPRKRSADGNSFAADHFDITTAR